MQTERHSIPTADGWELAARRILCPTTAADEEAACPPRPPVVVIPGYGMNSFIFGYHPTGRSFLQALAEEGLDPWTVDLRGQGASKRLTPRARLLPESWGMAEYAFQDVRAVVEHVCRVTGHPQIRAVGCSLGGSLLYAYMARFGAERISRLVTMGSPLDMVELSPMVTAAGLLGQAAGLLPVRGVRHMARHALPILARSAPRALSVYLNAGLVDLSRSELLAQAVENPKRQLNRELARWIRRRKLTVGGMDVGRGLVGLDVPTLIVVALGDGIVSPASCRSVTRHVPPGMVEELVVGSDKLHVAHADLFISEISDELVFMPIARWLTA